jgi:ABC-type uncharacterized transport system substrate-binding protein
MRSIQFRTLGLIAVLLVAVVSPIAARDAPTESPPERILVVDSYHRGYEWSDGIRQGIAQVLDIPTEPDVATSANGRLVVRTEFLDTKRHPGVDWSRTEAKRVASVVDAWQPAVVITCDDNAARDLIVPYLLNTSIPVVFCGVNWDASVYGLPAANVCGMIEVDQTVELVATLRRHARGDRLGLLVLDTTSGRRDAEVLRDYEGLEATVRLVADYAEWKDTFRAMQDEVDMLLLKQNITGAEGWNLDDAIAFTAEATRIPTGTTTEPVMRCVLASFIKNPAEQGIWAAGTALEILAGADPADIPLAENKESRIFLNMALARRLDVRFPMDLIERATFLEERWER